MSTDIDMASNALILLGDNPISSFTEAGFGATAAANLYNETYRDLLATHPWSFAFKEQYLNQLTSTPENVTGYTYAYQLPTDLIRIWETMENADYVIVGDKLYSNMNKILLRYVYQVDETSLPPHFVKTMEYKLAAEFAPFIGEQVQLANFYEQKYMMQLGKAMAIDSSSRPQVGIVDSPIVDVR